MKDTPRWSLNVRPLPPAHLVGAASWAVALLLPLLLGPASARAATYYVAPTGNNSNAGTMDAPFATMARGQQAAAAGDTVYFRGGTYKFVSSSDANAVALNKSGGSNNRIKYWAYQGEVPVFDFSGMTAAARITGIRVTASWIHLKGIEVKLVPQNITTQNESWGIYNDGGDNNIYEMLDLHHNMGPGFFLGSGSNNLILNCDSHHNYDPKSKAGDGENADGFGCHPKQGDTGNVFRGIRAWWNTDDGYDSINALESCLVEGSWAWLNGYLPDTMKEPNRNPDLPPGNGNGFKLGGFGIDGDGSPASPPKHTIRFSVAFQNVFAGFFANYHTGSHYFYNNTGFGNVGADFNMLGLNANTSVLRNNIAYGPNMTANMNGTDATTNSWNLPVQVTEADFQSISTVGMDGPRQADGSLPVVPFMRLVAGSDLIDKGVNISLPYNGAAPDLGAYETGGTGGASGSGGAGAGTGSGGAGGGTGSGGGGATGGSGGGGGGGATGGASASGGGNGSGGSSNATGGSSSGTGGGPGSGGALATGGASSSSGGAPAGSGGAGAGSGGRGGSGGQAPSAGVSDPAGCACSVSSDRESASEFSVLFFGLGLAAVRIHRRRAR